MHKLYPHFCISFIIVLNFPKEKKLDKTTKLYSELFFKENILKSNPKDLYINEILW